MSSEDLFANSEEVDNPEAMETDGKTENDSKMIEKKVGEEEGIIVIKMAWTDLDNSSIETKRSKKVEY